ncbi:MAG: hypothetical protein ABF271_15025 [Abyssibacter sp.]|uniref:hypothetical protein n=1 Tax=Abyssibacter sp. TaxID=2320200 RepID=UPI00321AD16A
MSALLEQAERLKLARVLGCEVDELGPLGDCSAQALRASRHAASNALFGRHRSLFSKLAGATRLLPTKLSAQFTQKFIGPTLAGRVASEMEPKQALALSERLPTPFLAQVCLSLDPGRSEAIIQAMPTALVIDVARELRANDEHIVMAQFADALTDEVVAAVMDSIDDPGDLLKIGFYIESKPRLETIISAMDDARLARTLVAADQQGLWPEALAMVDGTSESLRARMANLIAAQPDAVVRGVLDAADREGLWPLLADAVTQMDSPSRERLAALLDQPEWVTQLQAALEAQGADPAMIQALGS